MTQTSGKFPNQNTLKFILTFLFVFLIGLQVRLFPLQNYSPEIYNERATLYVVSKLKEKVAERINQQYPGIPASRTPDDLKYNQQPGFTFRLGMNYYLE